MKKEKENFFLPTLIQKNIADGKTFLQTVKPFFSDKALDSDQITLINNDEIISDDENIAETFKNFFSNNVKNLNLKVDENLLNQNLEFIEELLLRAIKHYEDHPSVKGIERNVGRRNFSFSFATFTDIEQELKNLNLKKASQDRIIQQES